MNSIKKDSSNSYNKILIEPTKTDGHPQPYKNLLEMVNIDKAEKAKNAGWYIFLSKNNFGATNHYADEQQIAVKAVNPMDTMDDSQILGLAQSLPDDESGTFENGGSAHNA